MYDTDTKRDILEYIRRNPGALVPQMQEHLGITPSAVRQHLAQLEEDGSIRAEREVVGAGRPRHRWFTTERCEDQFPKRYSKVTKEVIELLIELDGKEKLNEMLDLRLNKALEEFQQALEGIEGLEEKLEKIAQIQEANGYMARVENEEGLPMLKEHNCPFIDVARAYPQFCEAERKLYEALVGTKVRLRGCRARGDEVCTFNFLDK